MKKLLSVFIISLLVWNTCILPVAAATPSIVIDGGAVAGGGVAGGTNAKGDLAALLASLVLASQGVSVSLSSESTITPLDFIKSLLEDYANLAGKTFESVCDLWLSNVKILADGAISMGMDSCQAAYNFLSWLKGDNQIGDNLIGSFLVIDGKMCPILSPGESYSLCTKNGLDLVFENMSYSTTSCALLFCDEGNTNLSFYVICPNEGSLGYKYTGLYSGSGSNFISLKRNGLYYGLIPLGYDLRTVDRYNIPVLYGKFSGFLDSLNGFNETPGTPDSDSLVGDSSNVNPEDFNIPDNQINILNPGLDLSALASSSGIDGIVQIKEYIDALVRSVNGIEDNVLKVNDGITGILQELPIDLDIYDSISAETDDDSGNGVSIIDEQQYPDAETTQKYIKHMQFNLINVFPFCIPFDIVNLLSKLDVAPVTPHVNLTFPNPVLDEPIVFDLDFSQWNGVAQVVRNAELVAFVVGLAMVTRSLIRG